MNRKRLLYLTFRLPFPPRSGEKIRSFNTIKYLSKEYDITLISFIVSDEELKNVEEYKAYYSKLVTVKLSRFRSYLNVLTGFFSKKPLQVRYFDSRKMRMAVQAELKENYHALVCHLIRMAQYVPKETRCKKVIDLTDAISLNFQRSIKFRKGFWRWIYSIENSRVFNYEQASIDKFDKSILISEVDADFLRNGKNRHKIEVVGNGVQLFENSNENYDELSLLFLGCMRTFPNVDAATHFVHEVMPVLCQKFPKIKFYIVGSDPTPKVLELAKNPNVVVTGLVEEVLPYFRKSLAMVAPMRVGAGVQNKILEAMSAGTPVITSKIGAEGLDESFLMIAETPTEYFECINQLIKDRKLRDKLSREAIEYIRSNYSWEQVLKGFRYAVQ